MSQTLTIDFRKPVPLFPLPNCVLMPHATVPLHVFEQRYRQMTSDALDSRGLIAMALFEGNNWRAHYEGKPPIRPNVCLGYIVQHHQFDDGRYHLLLQGVCRARVSQEVPNHPYRLGMLEPTETQQTMEIDLCDQRDRLEALLNDPLLGELASVAAVQRWLSGELPTAALVDLTIMAVCHDTEQRYQMLAESDVQARARWLERLLRRNQSTLVSARRFEPPETTDGINVN